MKTLLAAIVAVAVAGSVLAGCSADGSDGDGACPLASDYKGDAYYTLKTDKPVHGGPLASVGFSSCSDGNGDDEAAQEDAQARFEAEVLDGVDPAVAFVVPSR